jgi:hypothetical protein
MTVTARLWRALQPLSSVFVAVPFYFAAFLGNWVTEVAQAKRPYGLLIHAAVVIVLLTTIVVVVRAFNKAVNAYRVQRERETRAKVHAYTLTDRIVVEWLARAHQWPGSGEAMVRCLITSLMPIQELVSAAYDTFEANFGFDEGSNERIEFEVTFMTKSYADGEITIPAAANRDKRSPRSMVLRAENPTIYNDTETASVYRAARPAPIVVEDTRGTGTNYAELYAGQKDRIRSSIIYPVLSDRNELLGTLVVHCDVAGFFNQRRQKYWFELLEIFSKRVALEKMKLDKIVEFVAKEGMQVKRVPFPF